MKRAWMNALGLAIVCLLGTNQLSSAQNPTASIQGPYTTVNVRGVPIYCGVYGGGTARIYLDPNLQNVGIASMYQFGEPTIVLNPNVLAQYSDTVAVWWVMHECAHLALHPAQNNENNADCFAAQKMVQHGLLNSGAQLETFAYELANLQGSQLTGHLPGTVRANNIAYCALSF